MRIEPEGLLVDSYHPGEGPHIHDTRNPGRRIPLGDIERDLVERRITEHLQAHGKILFDELVRELRPNGD